MSPGEILLISTGLDRDGGGAALLGRLMAGVTARFCAEEGRRLTVFHLGRERPDLPGEVQVRSFRGRREALAGAAWKRQVLPGSNQGRPAAVLFDHLGPARIQTLVPGFRRPPYLIFLLGIEVWRPLSFQRCRALAGASSLLAISHHTAERARPFFEPCLGPDLPSLQVLPLTLEEPASGGASRGEVDGELLEAVGSGFFLMVGRMTATEAYKGHREVLAALPAVLARQPEARLVIAGGGDDRERLGELARQRGLAGAVRFTGFVSEATLAELYRRCRALVLPSRDEGFGLVYLEAMRAGKAVVAARGSAAEEIVVPGETGVLVDPGRVEELSGALLSLLQDPERAERLGRSGHERWRREFSHALFRQRFDEHLRRLLAPSRHLSGR